MADNGGVGVALDIGPPLPARGIRMAGSDVLGLETFEFLLVAKLVGLESGRQSLADARLDIAQSRMPEGAFLPWF